MLQAGPARRLVFGCLVLVSLAIAGCGTNKAVSVPTLPAGSSVGAKTEPGPAAMTPPPAPQDSQPQAAPPKQEEPVSQVNIPPGSPLGEADTVLGGVKLGITLDAARQLFGQPKAMSGEWGSYWVFNGPQGPLDLYETDGIITEVDTYDVPTPRGLRKGDSQEQGEQLYGKPTSVNEKWGEWVYEGPRPFKLLVGIRGSRVAYVRIINFGLTQPKPEPGRDANAVTPVPPLGPDDFVIGTFTACWTPEQAERQGLEPFLPEDARASSGYASKDRHVQLLDDPGGMNTFTFPRRYRTIVSGGAYQTARDVRVGDPDSRVAALYGPGERHPEGRETLLSYRAGDLSLIFTANINGRITAIELACFVEHP